MADLLLARARGLEGFERHVVVKRIRSDQEEDQSFVEMFLAEARLAAALHHHNIVQVYDIGQEDGKPYFAMEYVHGEDLRCLMRVLHRRREQVPLQHVITIVAAAANALHHAHEQKGPDGKSLGIVHRDVTPANILVGYDGNVKVVDFGIAKAALRRTETVAGMLKGKAPYMAPEQCTGNKIDRRSDVFALGIVLYELATVRRLFKGENDFITMSAVVKGEIPKPSLQRPDLPAELEEIIMRALSREPAARYQTAEQMFNALDEFSINAGLRTSASALANYMKQVCGERPEPWLVVDHVPETEMSVDFDGSSVGLAAAPSEAIESQSIPKAVVTNKSSPLARARTNAITGAPPVVTPDRSAGVPMAVPAQKSVQIRIPDGPVASPSAPRTRSATRAPVPPPTQARRKTIQIPVTPAPSTQTTATWAGTTDTGHTAVLANPLAIEKPAPKPAVELDEDAQLPKTAVVANPLVNGNKLESSRNAPTENARVGTRNAKTQNEKGSRNGTTESSSDDTGTKPLSMFDVSTSTDVLPAPPEAPKPAPAAAAPKSPVLPSWSKLGSRTPLKDDAPTITSPPSKSTLTSMSKPMAAQKPVAKDDAPTLTSKPPSPKPLPSLVKPKSAAVDDAWTDPPSAGIQRRLEEAPTEITPLPPLAELTNTPSAPTAPIVPASMHAKGKERGERADTDIEEMTDVAAPPPPPITGTLAVVSTGSNRDSTEIVKPLPSPMMTDAPKARRSSSASVPVELARGTVVEAAPKRPLPMKLIGGIAGFVALGVVLGVFLMRGSGDDAQAAPEPARVPTPETKSAASETPDEAPRQPRTWANSEKPSNVAAPTEPTPTEPAVVQPVEPEPVAVEPEPEIEVEPEPEPEPDTKIATEPTTKPATPPDPKPATKPVAKVATKPAPKPAPKPVIKKAAAKPAPKQVKKVTTKPATKPATKAKPFKPAAKPAWDPNSLFPKKK